MPSSPDAQKGALSSLGATILSNSWICYGYGDCGDSNFSRHFDTKGIACVAASSDGAYDQIDARSVLDSASDGRYKKYYSGPGGWGTPNGIL